jgi:hypothetical protein
LCGHVLYYGDIVGGHGIFNRRGVCRGLDIIRGRDIFGRRGFCHGDTSSIAASASADVVVGVASCKSVAELRDPVARN